MNKKRSNRVYLDNQGNPFRDDFDIFGNDIFGNFGTRKPMGVNIAAMAAALSGDLPNALAAASPGGIEAQEAQGQRDLCSSGRIPIKIHATQEFIKTLKANDAKDKSAGQLQLESLGIKILGKADNLFYNVELPKGWAIKPTDHSMWSDLVDDQGIVRASIFYKAAFYDMDAFLNFK